MNDGSLASLTEQWIADQVKALAPFTNSTVEPFKGSLAENGQQLLAELTANRSPYACVLFEADSPVELEEGQQRYEPIYAIYIVVQNPREGSARKGDGTTPGTNLIRDLIRNALHDQKPGLSANGWYTDRARFSGVQVVFQRSDAFVMRAEVVVTESVAA